MKPMIQIVDKDDNLIGYKPRDQVDYENDIYRVAALWLTDTKGRVLIAQRKHTKDKDPGKWGPAVAGTVDQGETYKDNIYKEAEEEIGLVGVKFVKGPKTRVYTPRNYFAQWYIALVDRPIEEFIPQEEEVENLAWVDQKDLEADLNANPEKYIANMSKTVELFTEKNTR
jgi:isopentenyldiphosphate isomerase